MAAAVEAKRPSEVKRPFEARADFQLDDEGHASKTSEAQGKCERECASLFAPLHSFPEVREHARVLGDSLSWAQMLQLEWSDSEGRLGLGREAHMAFLEPQLLTLPSYATGFDSSRPWLAYWLLNSLDLLRGVSSKEEPIVEAVGSEYCCWLAVVVDPPHLLSCDVVVQLIVIDAQISSPKGPRGSMGASLVARDKCLTSRLPSRGCAP
jgi:hypothetical protein